MIVRKVLEKQCPSCLQVQLQAIEIEEGHVASYVCYSCGAYYDAEINHDYEPGEDWWIGKLRNRDFGDHEIDSIIDGLAKMEKGKEERVQKYLGRYPIERIKA